MMIRTCTAVGCNYYEFELLAARSYGMQSDRRVWRRLVRVQHAPARRLARWWELTLRYQTRLRPTDAECAGWWQNCRRWPHSYRALSQCPRCHVDCESRRGFRARADRADQATPSSVRRQSRESERKSRRRHRLPCAICDPPHSQRSLVLAPR